MKDNEIFDFEENLRRLDDIINTIEAGETPLDAALALYKKGMALAADCAKRLNEIEGEFAILTKNAIGIIERRPFAEEDDA